MVKTIGEAHRELKELKRRGLLEKHLEDLIRNQEERLSMKHFGVPILIVTMDIHNKLCYKDGKILLQYWDEEYLYHELGHFYWDKLCKKKLDLDFHKGDGKKDITEWWEARNRLISEGIATYFKREMNEGKDEFNDLKFPKNMKEFLRNNLNFLLNLYYEGGYHLVKPILNKFGVEKGCEYLILNPATKEDLINLSKYRKKILAIESH